MTPAAERARLAHPAICPACGAQTSVDPCAYCHTYLPKALGGKRTFGDDADGNAAADRLARMAERPELAEVEG